MSDAATPVPPVFEATALRKNYGAVQALTGVDFSVRAGETVALVGDNGAGKSTLVKCIAGVIRPSGGTMCWKGESVQIGSTKTAQSLGIETVYQDLGLCDNMSVAENVFLGRERTRRFGPFRILDKRGMRDTTRELLEDLAINVPHVSTTTQNLSGGQRQAVALTRAKLWRHDLVLLDEPTAALGVQESQKAMEIVQRMQDQGLAVVLISHNIPQVMELSHRVVVLRHGEKVGDVPTDDIDEHGIVSLITGAEEKRLTA